MRKQEEMKTQLRQLVSEVQRVDDKSSETERLIELKTRDLKQKEQQAETCARDVLTLKGQLNSFSAELNNLKSIEAKYKEENEEIQRNINEESCANAEF